MNEDNPPLKVDDIHVLGLLRRLIFRTDVDATYRLYYGSRSAVFPSYDVEHYFTYLQKDNLPRATIGSQHDNLQFSQELPAVTERYRWLLPSALMIGILLMAVLVFTLLRQFISAIPPRNS